MTFLEEVTGLFIIAYVILGALVVRRPLLGRIAVREVRRRPGQAAVVVGGLMVAGAAIFATQVLLDSIQESWRGSVLESWGRDDLEITGGGSFFPATLAASLSADPALRPKADAFQNAIATQGSLVDIDRNAGKPSVEVVGLDLRVQRHFGTFQRAGGGRSVRQELAGGGVFLSRILADEIGARPGDRLRVQVRGQQPQVVNLAAVVEGHGAGAYGQVPAQGVPATPRSLFASLETAQRLAGTTDVNLVRVAAPGNGPAEVDAGSRLAPVLRGAVAGTGLQVLEGKRAALNIIEVAQQNRGFVTGFGVIVALAATAIVANLAIMLADERRPRLAVLRALGLTRTGLVQLSLTEGAIYSLLGALLGLPAGLALGLVFALAESGSPANQSGSLGALSIVVHPGSLLGSVAGAALINLATVLVASLRTSRMAISAAIRDLPEPERPTSSSTRRLVLLGTAGVAGGLMLAVGSVSIRLLGGTLLITALGGVARGRLTDRLRYSAAGAAVAAWAVAYFSLDGARLDSSDQSGVLAIALVVSVVALSMVVAANLPVLETLAGLAGRSSRRLRATLRPALAYSSRRPLRSGLAVAAFALIMALLTLVELLESTAAQNARLYNGGWSVQVTAAGTDRLTLPLALAPEVSRQAVMPGRSFSGATRWTYADFRKTVDWHQETVTVYALSDAQLAAGGVMPLVHLSPRLRSEADAWQAIAHDPSLIAASVPLGSVVELATAGGVARYEVVAQIPSSGGTSSLVPGLLGSERAMQRLASAAPTALMLLKAAPDTGASALARNVQRELLASGADATTADQLFRADYNANRGLVDFLLVLMRLGLLVGVMSLGAVALRAEVERRRPIGVLRALGFQPEQVVAGMLVETAAITTCGLAVGVAVALGLAGPFLDNLAPGGRLTVDLGSIAATAGLVYVAVLGVTALPALRAARLKPAEALRVVG